jgi:polysaccharide deacetylase 2 family uncharacterized protein YibQ
VASKKPSKKRLSFQLTSDRLSLLAALLTILASILVIIVSIRTGAQQETGKPSATTLWPYGLPEYHVEVPEGYEGLLPSATEAPAEAQGVGKSASGTGVPDGRAAGGSATEPDAGLGLPRLPLEYQGERALPYPIALRQAEAPAAAVPTLIIVIDDAGHNIEQLEPFLKLPFPLTLAVLPGLGYSRESAERIVAAGKELILHQPMQALGGADTGPKAIRLDMSVEQATAVLTENLEALPGIAGLNNHMGSAVTRDPKLMRIVLDIAKKRGIYYLDSLTSSGTATAVLCREMELPYWERDVFLDNSGDRQSILHALEEGKKTAQEQGAAVMIGHVWSSELAQTLMDIYPQLIEDGYSLSTISHYMIKSAAGEVDADTGD